MVSKQSPHVWRRGSGALVTARPHPSPLEAPPSPCNASRPSAAAMPRAGGPAAAAQRAAAAPFNLHSAPAGQPASCMALWKTPPPPPPPPPLDTQHTSCMHPGTQPPAPHTCIGSATVWESRVPRRWSITCTCCPRATTSSAGVAPTKLYRPCTGGTVRQRYGSSARRAAQVLGAPITALPVRGLLRSRQPAARRPAARRPAACRLLGACRL